MNFTYIGYSVVSRAQSCISVWNFLLFQCAICCFMEPISLPWCWNAWWVWFPVVRYSLWFLQFSLKFVENSIKYLSTKLINTTNEEIFYKGIISYSMLDLYSAKPSKERCSSLIKHLHMHQKSSGA